MVDVDLGQKCHERTCLPSTLHSLLELLDLALLFLWRLGVHLESDVASTQRLGFRATLVLETLPPIA